MRELPTLQPIKAIAKDKDSDRILLSIQFLFVLVYSYTFFLNAGDSSDSSLFSMKSELHLESNDERTPNDLDPLLNDHSILLTQTSNNIKAEESSSSCTLTSELQRDTSDERSSNDSYPLLGKNSNVSSGISEEIIDEEADASSAASCRICLEHDAELDDELISPCMCRGTQQFVHRSCLDHWRSVKEGFAFSHCTTCKAQFHLRVESLEDYSWRKIKFRIFVARDVLLVFLAVQTAIAVIGGLLFLMDKDGSFRNSFSDSWDRILSKHPIPFYYCLGVIIFLVLLGFFGLIFHCSSLNNNDPCMTGCRNCCYGWGILDCFPASMEACFALVIVFVVIFAILGIAYGFFAATMAIQRIWQRHYHILTKRELTKEYIVVDLGGCYTQPKLDPEHEVRLRTLKLL